MLEPYRYVVRPIGAEPSSAGPPTTATARLPVRGGLTAEGVTLTTAEARPQAVLFLPRQGLQAAAPALDVVLEPLAPAPLPDGYRADGNRYRVRFGTPARTAQQGAFATLQLRAASPRDDLVVLVRSAAQWTPVETTPGPGGFFGAPFTGPYEYQLASRETAPPQDRSVPLVLGGAVLVLLLAVGALRSRTRQTSP